MSIKEEIRTGLEVVAQEGHKPIEIVLNPVLFEELCDYILSSFTAVAKESKTNSLLQMYEGIPIRGDLSVWRVRINFE